jgi:hypothetical protein
MIGIGIDCNPLLLSHASGSLVIGTISVAPHEAPWTGMKGVWIRGSRRSDDRHSGQHCFRNSIFDFVIT